MNLANLAGIADILAAVGVIASLLFVAYEVRRNTNEVKRTNWERMIDRFNTLWSRTSGDDLADVIARGRQEFGALTDGEKLAFGNYYNELCLTYEAMLVIGREQILGDGLAGLCMKHLRYYFAFPGAREWWKDFAETRGLSPIMMRAMREATGHTE
jgi:hypothetical protein